MITMQAILEYNPDTGVLYVHSILPQSLIPTPIRISNIPFRETFDPRKDQLDINVGHNRTAINKRP